MKRARDGGLPPELVAPPPGDASRALARRLARVESPNVTFLSDSFPIFWDRARGSNVWDADGNRFVDLTAGFGVAATGHAHPRVVEAIRAQAERLPHGMGDVHPPAAKVALLERLAELAPWPDARTVLTTSGAEAVEVALKTAHLKTGRPGVLAFTGAYHGLTYGALAVTDGPRFRAPFERQLNPYVLRASFPAAGGARESGDSSRGAAAGESGDSGRGVEAGGAGAHRAAEADDAVAAVRAILESEAGARVGAVIVEPIQGRGGVVLPPPGFLAALAETARGHGALLILDEILTGFGRTGRRFACEAEGMVPDLLCAGKALSGGMPIAACIGSAEAMDAWPPSSGEAMHTSTFLGHPIACAAALAALEVIEEEALAERAAEEGARWREALADMARAHPGVAEVRGSGLLVGIELARADGSGRANGERAARTMVEALRRGWIVLKGGPAGHVLTLTPPLDMPRALLDAAVEALDESLAAARETPSGA